MEGLHLNNNHGKLSKGPICANEFMGRLCAREKGSASIFFLNAFSAVLKQQRTHCDEMSDV